MHPGVSCQGSEAREAVALTAFQPQDMASRHQPLPHHSPAQNKRQRLAPTHSMHRQQHPPLPAIPVNNRHQPLPAIPEMAARGIHTSRSHHHHASSGLLHAAFFFVCSNHGSPETHQGKLVSSRADAHAVQGMHQHLIRDVQGVLPGVLRRHL